MTKPLPEGFKEVVLEWLNNKSRFNILGEAVELTACGAYGTDWAGDTDAGFHSEHRCELTWVLASGKKVSRDVEGEEMMDLWNAVVSGWPTP